MWKVVVFLNLWILHCTVSSSPPSPVNVSFSSLNLRNVLHWFPADGTPDHTHFNVEYAIYGDSIKGSKGRRVNWRAVKKCTEIVRTWCDLSNEMCDLEQGYHARVRAVGRKSSSKWTVTRRRFDPKLDTSFGPPLVSVEIENDGLTINLKGPMRYQPNNQTPVVSMATLYPQMTYIVSIRNNQRNQVHHFSVDTGPFKYQLLDYNTEYCFSAESKFLSMPIQCQSSAWQCITTPKDPVVVQMQWVVVGIVVPSLCVCVMVVAAYFLYHYLTGKGQKNPYILNPPSFHPPPLTFPPENLNFILISIIKDDSPSDACSVASNPACSKPQLCITSAAPPCSYFPQGSETPPLPGEPWDDSSIDYGFISTTPRINVGRRDKGEEGMKEDDHPIGSYAPQAKSVHICRQIQVAEVNTPVQVHAWSQVNPIVPEVNRKQEFPGLFINKNQQNDLFTVPLNLNKEVGREEKMDEEMRARADRKKEVDKDENMPLLSGYTTQNIQNMPHSDQSALLSDDYGVLRPAAAQYAEEDDGYDDEEEQGAICVNWDPETRELQLPEFNGEEGLDRLMLPYAGRQDRMADEDEEAFVMKGELKLENVFVRQASEEDEAQREVEQGRETGWQVDDILSKWNLTISMDQ
ncbi:interleukin-20 receptor subunit alpha [Amphiprion ocellaris]|uniref:Fibronectin type-III domain-containing protein n=1 Tax=Amphiprion ocellaris TaxID=80972 RepID=A0AAQ5Y4G5_AMPOC|nr:interleukin-20 receptor subunit alpha [Amphiprion ocellaris]